MNTKALGFSVLLAGCLPGAAMAATATGTLNVSITIAATCTVVSATAIDFGTVSAIAANIDQTSTLTVNCSNTTPYSIGIGLGSGGGTTAARKMMNGTDFVTYALYRDAGRTQLWGSTIGTDTLGAQTGNAANQTITIYGRVASQTVPPPGVYSDAVTVTINY